MFVLVKQKTKVNAVSALSIMINAILIINNHGKTRLCRFYTRIDQKKQQKIVGDVFSIVSKRGDLHCNFVELSKLWISKYTQKDVELIKFCDSKLIYRRYATLLFIFIVDASESELGILDIIQVFVEVLAERFTNVCELDIVYNYEEVNKMLDEIVMAGMVLETDVNTILKAHNDSILREIVSQKMAKKSVTKLKSHV